MTSEIPQNRVRNLQWMYEESLDYIRSNAICRICCMEKRSPLHIIYGLRSWFRQNMAMLLDDAQLKSSRRSYAPQNRMPVLLRSPTVSRLPLLGLWRVVSSAGRSTDTR